MDNLYYTVSYGVGNTVDDDGVHNIYDEHPGLETRNKFTIDIFGQAIMPSQSRSPLFRCRNHVAHLSCIYVGNDNKGIKASSVSEAYYRAKHADKELVVIEGITFDEGCVEVADVLKSIYTIVNYEAKNTYFAVDDVVVHWELDDLEFEIVDKYTDWVDNNILHIEDNCRYVLLQR